MKEWLIKVFSFLKRIFLFLRLHIRIEAGIEKDSNKEKENVDVERQGGREDD